jgi:16S rRNA processing protein RimM
VRIELLTDWPDRLDVGAEVFVEGEDRPRRIEETEPGGRVPVIHLEGVDTREAAEALAGRYLEAEAGELPAGTYYWHELEGMTVSDEAGMPLGSVEEVFRAGGNEVYRVVGPAGEVLVPALKRVVRRIDVEGRRMIVRLDPDET